MRFLLALMLIGGAGAQTPAQTPPAAPAAAEQQAAPAAQTPAQPAAKADQKPAESPAPATEDWLTGSIDFGYRWLVNNGGNFQQYRSVINLGEGPKLFGLDLTFQDPKKRLFDRLDLRAYGWGGDPYSTAYLGARKQGVYDFTVDYRNIAYFNAVPSFANPNLPGGFNEQSFDIHRRNTSVTLDLRPGKRIVPYLAFDRNSDNGRTITTWVQDANNDFAVPSLSRSATNNYRGGVHFEFNRFHVTVEQGGTTFQDNDSASAQGLNTGNNTTPVLGQPDVLTGLAQAYGIRGHSIYEKLLFTARPASWLDIYGQYLYSDPRTEVHYADVATGNFAQIDSLLFYSALQTMGAGAAVQPHNTANLGFELRPFRRLRILESWMTDRYHDAASPLVSELLLLGGNSPSQTLLTSLNYGQVVNYNQQQTDLLFDLTSKITLRGGYRYVWGDATVLAGQLTQTGPLVSGRLQRNVGLAGMTFRPSEKLSVNLDYEGAASDHIYFRSSLNNYSRARARARYQVFHSLALQASFRVLSNQNPAPDISNSFLSRDNSLAVYWTPAANKHITLVGEYDRSTVRSDINYLGLFFAPAVSSYRDRAHTATSAIDIALPGLSGAKLTAGGSLFVSAGSAPTRFYQPLLRLTLPLHKHLYWNTEWQYYGFGEEFYLFEGFRTNIFMTGLRVTR